MQQRLVGPAWGERTPLCTSLQNTGPTQGNKNIDKFSWKDNCILAFCCHVLGFVAGVSTLAFLPLPIQFRLLVGSTSLARLGHFCCMLSCSWHVAMWWVWDKMRNWMKLILEDWDLFKKSSPRDKFPPILLDPSCSPNSWGNEGKGHLDPGRWKDIFEFPIHMGLVDLTYTHWLHGIDWSNFSNEHRVLPATDRIVPAKSKTVLKLKTFKSGTTTSSEINRWKFPWQ